MNDKLSTPTECLFSIVSSFNSILDRLDILTDRLEELIFKNDQVFSEMREEFFRKVIQYEVDKEMQKKKRGKHNE